MTRTEVLQQIMDAIGEALQTSAAYQEAVGHLTEVGLENRVEINVNTFVRADARRSAPQTDEDFLRSMRIAPNLEVR